MQASVPARHQSKSATRGEEAGLAKEPDIFFVGVGGDQNRNKSRVKYWT